jgi:nicotinamidase-related amidase
LNVSSGSLEPKRTALLLFDMLNGTLKKDGPGMQARYPVVVANAVRLLEAARSAGALVAYTCHLTDTTESARRTTDTDAHLRPWSQKGWRAPAELIVAGSWEARVIDELAPRSEDPLIPKYRWSAFHQTCLDLVLRTHGIDTLIIAGESTDFGVAGPIFAARDLDSDTVVVSDACASEELDNHHQLMRRMFPRMSRVRTTDEVVRMLGG